MASQRAANLKQQADRWSSGRISEYADGTFPTFFVLRHRV